MTGSDPYPDILHNMLNGKEVLQTDVLEEVLGRKKQLYLRHS